jgi:hypothetical protein
MVESLNDMIIWISKNYLGILSIAFLFFLIFLPGRIMSRSNPKLKRGVCIMSEALPEDQFVFLQQLTEEVTETMQIFSMKKDGSFIRKRGHEILIIAMEKGYSTSHPLIGYVELLNRYPMIQYRTSLAGFVLLIPFVALIVPIPLIFLFEYYNFKKQRSFIRNFIRRAMQAKETNQPLITNLIDL